MGIILAEKALPYHTSDLFKKLGINIQDAALPRAKRSTATKAPRSRSPTLIAGGDTIFEGNRNNTLASLAGTMRSKGLGFDAIKAALIAANETQVSPPLPDAEVEQIADSIMRYEPSDSSSTIMQTLNDVGNAYRFVNMHQIYLRYVLGMEVWMIWQDDRWLMDTTGVHIMVLAKMTVNSIFQEVALQTNVDIMRAVGRHANNSHNAARLKAMQ